MEAVVIGLDIGTSSVKAASFDENGRLLSRASRAIDLHSPAPGWAEQDPLDWWAAACAVLKETLNDLPSIQVTALGLSGQCPGHVLVDADRQSIGKAIIWRDQRAVKEAVWLAQEISPAQSLAWVGTETLADASCPPARLLWLKRNREQDWNRAVAVLQPKDYVALQLTGQLGTDRLSAYCLVNPLSGNYDQDYFNVLGLPVGKMPPALLPTEVLGHVNQKASLQTGLKDGTPVVIGMIDAYCDNLAGGVLHPGRAVDVAGSSEIVSLAVTGNVEAQGLFPASLAGEGNFLCGPMQAGGDTLRWLSICFYDQTALPVDYAGLEQQARLAPPGCNGLVFLPYLDGERAPLWDVNARAAFVGLTSHHDRRHFTRAVYESIGFAIRHILEISEHAAGQAAPELVICGGGSRSTFWNQVKADILQRPVHPTTVSETGCLGAAMLASVGIGVHPGLKQAGDSMILFADSLAPDPLLGEVYEISYRAYRDYYPALKSILPAGGSQGEAG
jgi:xylulokinase